MKRQAAFTLFETVLALAFLAICLTLFLRWQGISVGMVVRGREYMVRIARLSDSLAECMYLRKNPHNDQKSGSFVVSKDNNLCSIKPISSRSTLASYAHCLSRLESATTWDIFRASEGRLALVRLVLKEESDADDA